MISSIENNKIKLLLKLKQNKFRKSEKMFIVEGEHLVEEAKKCDVLIEAYSIYEKDNYVQISENIMKKISTTNTIVNEIGLCKYIEKTKLQDKVLILDGIQDPGNLGTLMRSACAFGFETIVIGNGTVDIYNEKVIRSSQGAIFKLNFIYKDILEFIDEVSDYDVYGTDVVNGINLDDIKTTKKIAIILGNEGNGIRDEVRKKLSKNIYIPMENMESLNVAIAGSIIMYKLR